MNDERSRRWQLTENNADYTKEQCAERLASIGETIYVVSCSEKGAKGTEHIHAFIIYANSIRLTSIKKYFPRAHLERCLGSNVQNRAYVVKDDKKAFESGKMPLANESNRKEDVAKEVVELLSNGEPLESIMLDYPTLCDYVVRNYRSLKEIEKDLGYRTRRR